MTLFSAVKNMVNKHYEAQAEHNCNTCHVGAWVIGREQHFTDTSGGCTMKALFKRLVGNRKAAVENVPNQNETIAVKENCDCTHCKILVVCKGSSFSDGVMDYAIDMAAKTRSGLVALNLDTTGRDFSVFQARSEENIDRFSDRAANAGLLFSHEVRHGDEESVIGKMYQEDAQFRYVMDDSAVVCKNRKVIPVYTRATLRAK